MKTCLIVPTELGSVGRRMLSSCLRAHGHETRLVFIPGLVPVKDGTRYARNVKFVYSDRLKQMLLEVVQDCDLIGFSVLAQFYEPLADISDFIRQKLGKPVVWGRIHAIMWPQSCLAHADLVCLGEGEETLLDIVEGLKPGAGPGVHTGPHVRPQRPDNKNRFQAASIEPGRLPSS
ncbi:MAG: cobalamin-dependent protein [Deltaproteobacteria bacterium]|nr:cobalamin-dependent protein [Deltaproteobacteria bacterium]